MIYEEPINVKTVQFELCLMMFRIYQDSRFEIDRAHTKGFQSAQNFDHTHLMAKS